MKANQKTTERMVKVPQKGLLALVASKLKDRVLFPEKLEEAKLFLKKVQSAK